MKKALVVIIGIIIAGVCILGCEKNPFTGKRTLAITNNESLLVESFAAYENFLDESYCLDGTPDAEIVEKVGNKLRIAAEQWLSSIGETAYLDNYQWEFHLVESSEVNAWCMPGGKIVVYTGILPIAQTEAGLAAVMGHELAHALLNHGRQQESAGILKFIGAIGVAIATKDSSENDRENALTAYDVGTTFLADLPFSRKHENEADKIGLMLMTIAGYDPNEAVDFWSRMEKQDESFQLEFISTHPSDKKRIDNIKKSIPQAEEFAAAFQAE
jgi:predicted Zn-dependent protease